MRRVIGLHPNLPLSSSGGPLFSSLAAGIGENMADVQESIYWETLITQVTRIAETLEKLLPTEDE